MVDVKRIANLRRKRFAGLAVDVLAVLSVFMCVATVVQWQRSYQTEDDLVYLGRSICTALHTMNGSLAFVYTNAIWSERHIEYSTMNPRPGFNYAAPRREHTVWSWLGFYFAYSSGPSSGNPNPLPPGMSYPRIAHFCEVLVPLWLVVVMLLVLPAWRFVVQPVRSRKRPGCCAVCGYDLRATPDRCPECGTIAANVQ
jgi:hypothetical protein